MLIYDQLAVLMAVIAIAGAAPLPLHEKGEKLLKGVKKHGPGVMVHVGTVGGIAAGSYVASGQIGSSKRGEPLAEREPIDFHKLASKTQKGAKKQAKEHHDDALNFAGQTAGNAIASGQQSSNSKRSPLRSADDPLRAKKAEKKAAKKAAKENKAAEKAKNPVVHDAKPTKQQTGGVAGALGGMGKAAVDGFQNAATGGGTYRRDANGASAVAEVFHDAVEHQPAVEHAAASVAQHVAPAVEDAAKPAAKGIHAVVQKIGKWAPAAVAVGGGAALGGVDAHHSKTSSAVKRRSPAATAAPRFEEREASILSVFGHVAAKEGKGAEKSGHKHEQHEHKQSGKSVAGNIANNLPAQQAPQPTATVARRAEPTPFLEERDVYSYFDERDALDYLEERDIRSSFEERDVLESLYERDLDLTLEERDALADLEEREAFGITTIFKDIGKGIEKIVDEVKEKKHHKNAAKQAAKNAQPTTTAHHRRSAPTPTPHFEERDAQFGLFAKIGVKVAEDGVKVAEKGIKAEEKKHLSKSVAHAALNNAGSVPQNNAKSQSKAGSQHRRRFAPKSATLAKESGVRQASLARRADLMAALEERGWAGVASTLGLDASHDFKDVVAMAQGSVNIGKSLGDMVPASHSKQQRR